MNGEKQVRPKIATPEHTKARLDVALLGEETGGALIFRSQDVVPDEGTPLHKHSEQEETFHIISGEFRFLVGNDEYFVKAGTTLFVPKGVPHSLLNIGNSAGKIISILTPGIYDGFVMNVPEAQKQGMDAKQLTELAATYGATILGPKQSYQAS